MTFSLYDSASARQVDFVPLVPGEVSIYCCGLTVYAAPHLGHIRKEVVFDTLRRWLTWSGYRVSLVVNVTDMDDKILAAAAAENRPWFAHAYLYERALHRATAALGCLPPTYEPHATGTITEQIELIEEILKAGHAYVATDGSGDVYFDVVSWPGYGDLSHQRLADMAPAEDADPRGKRDPRDFALWKGHKPSEPVTASWPSPWGRGRPGWHLECSAMAGKFLGDAFDIHGGGIDLKFPHHENERAQSQAAGRGFARHWMHCAFVTDPMGEKMSKSLSNGMLVSEVVQHHAPRAVRYYLVAPHYRSMVEFSDQALTEAAASLARIDSFVTRAGERVGRLGPSRVFDPITGALVPRRTGDDRALDPMTEAPAPGAEPAMVTPPALPPAFVAALDDDLGTPAAVAQLHDTVREGNRALDSGDEATVATALRQVQDMLAILGLWRDDPAWGQGRDDLEPIVDGLVQALLEQRQAARARRDYAAADQIRDRLQSLGLTIEDTPTGSRWRR